MKKALVVVDMQNDFIDGALGTKEAVSIVPNVVKKIQEFDGLLVFTKDTHESNYLDSREGRTLPVEHCIRDTDGWEIREEVWEAAKEKNPVVIGKPTFGSRRLGEFLSGAELESVELVGLCTDICVISNAMLVRAFLPEVPIRIDASCCAGVTPESHENALLAMKACQMEIVWSYGEGEAAETVQPETEPIQEAEA